MISPFFGALLSFESLKNFLVMYPHSCGVGYSCSNLSSLTKYKMTPTQANKPQNEAVYRTANLASCFSHCLRSVVKYRTPLDEAGIERNGRFGRELVVIWVQCNVRERHGNRVRRVGTRGVRTRSRQPTSRGRMASANASIAYLVYIDRSVQKTRCMLFVFEMMLS